jgi:hypothetical protein
MRLFPRLASTVTVLLAAGLLLAPAAAADPGFSTGPRIVEHAPEGSPRLVDLRAGRHDRFDRVVFHIDGQIPWYSFRYVPVVRQDGSGLPISPARVGVPGGRAAGRDRHRRPLGPGHHPAPPRPPGPA